MMNALLQRGDVTIQEDGGESVALDHPPERTPRSAVTWLGRGFLAVGTGMLPWLFFLASTLPSATRAEHWSTAWVGLDGLEALGLLTTGVALICRCDWLCLPAAMTATLLVIDAWFDITTSAPGAALTAAVVMAAFAELPAAGLCAVLAIRNFRYGVNHGRAQGNR